MVVVLAKGTCRRGQGPDRRLDSRRALLSASVGSKGARMADRGRRPSSLRSSSSSSALPPPLPRIYHSP